MFDLDETAESRQSMTSDTRALSNSSGTNSSGGAGVGGRNLSSESTGPLGGDSFYSFGKALTLSLTLQDPDHKSPSRRSSLTGLSVAPPVHGAHGSGGSPKANAYSHAGGSSGTKNLSNATSYAHLSRANHSEYLMWESGFCSKAGIRDSQEDRFACHPNINDQVQNASLGVPSSSGAVSGDASSSGLGGGVDGAGGYFGVYDGHGGQAAAVYLEKNLLSNICSHPQFSRNMHQAVTEGCIRTDKDFLVSTFPSLRCRVIRHNVLFRFRCVCFDSGGVRREEDLLRHHRAGRLRRGQRATGVQHRRLPGCALQPGTSGESTELSKLRHTNVFCLFAYVQNVCVP